MSDHATSTLLSRIRGEFLEMPGLHLTAPQAARLWALDQAVSDRILGELVSSGFLYRGAGRRLRARLRVVT
jgi:hypothetical protein